MDQLQLTPISSSVKQVAPQLLGNLATFTRTTTPLSLNHYNVQPVFDVFANVQGTDLGTVARAVDGIVAQYRRQISNARTITAPRQVQSIPHSLPPIASATSPP